MKRAPPAVDRGRSFAPGDAVRVREAYPPGHVRTPFFIRGKVGVVESHAGRHRNPEELAYGRPGDPKLSLYRVRFRQGDIWPDYAGPAQDTAVVDIYEHWLDPAEAS
ncbi:MAG: nitrile hydratase subunit beta [Alphaproteobacteria bacterium]|nr:nitrile hydratase subunit beta [Alphaproteobacteria bacterium]